MAWGISLARRRGPISYPGTNEIEGILCSFSRRLQPDPLQRGGGLGQRAHPSVQAGRRGGRRRALAQFQQQWGTYRKIVEGDLLSHREIGRILHDTLNDVFKQPFSFLDIACGDAFMMKTALAGTRIRHYHGIDLSQPALDIAARNLAGLPCEVDLDHRDFVEAMMRRHEHADAAWCSLSIHHLSTNDKLNLMKAIRAATGKRGILKPWIINLGKSIANWFRRG